MRGVVWCNGAMPSESLLDMVLSDGVPVFGVDGGADKAKAAGVSLEGVLGDLDSVDKSNWSSIVHELQEQSSSDLSKSIAYLNELGYDEIEVVGIEGGRPEHVLGIWGALAEAPLGCTVRLHHEDGISHRVHPDTGEFQLNVPKGHEFSVFALEPCRASIIGARWQVEDEMLSFSTRGLHNEGTGGTVVISANGVLVIIVPR